MPQLTRECTREVGVEFHHFCLQETDDDLVPVPYPDGDEAAAPAFLTTYEMRVDVESGGHTHTATLTAQLWDGPPTEDTSTDWEVQDATEIYSPSGELSFVTTGGAQLETLNLGAPARRWGLRVHSRGRQEVARLAREGVPHSVEQYLMQFWPVAGE